MTLLTIFNDTAIIYTLFGDCDLFSRQVYEYLLKYNNTRHAIRWHCYRLHVTISLLDDMSYCMTCHTAWHVILNDMSYGMTSHTEWHVIWHDMSYWMTCCTAWHVVLHVNSEQRHLCSWNTCRFLTTITVNVGNQEPSVSLPAGCGQGTSCGLGLAPVHQLSDF